MGAVLLVEDQELARPVALKLMRGQLPQVARARFTREAETLARVRHPNVVELYDFGETPEGPYMVLEHLQGQALDRAPVEDPVATLLEVAAGLEAVHGAGLIHRDLKPANVVRTEAGRAVLIDFGLTHAPDMTALTRTGCLVGTLPYFAPELLRGQAYSPASDWYAWGASLYTLLEGSPPYSSEVLMAHASGAPLPTPAFRSAAGRAPGTRHLLEVLLGEDPAARPGNLEEIRELLGEVPGGSGGSRAEALAAPTELGRPRGGDGVTEVVGAPSVPGRVAPRHPPWRALVGLVMALALGGVALRRGPGRAPRPPDLIVPLPSPEPRRAALEARRQARAALEYPTPGTRPEDWLRLAVLLRDGLGGPPDPDLAFELLERARQLGRPEAHLFLGECHELGLGTPRDLRRAREAYRAGLEAGDGRCRVPLAWMLERGLGGPEDPSGAGELRDALFEGEGARAFFEDILPFLDRSLRVAEAPRPRLSMTRAMAALEHGASRGAPWAAFGLGLVRYHFEPPWRDHARAYLHFTEASEQGIPWGTLGAAECLELGRGVPADPTRARALYRKLLVPPTQEEASLRLGRMLLRGAGGPADPVEGRRLLAIAREAGIAGAAEALGTKDPPARSSGRGG